MKHQLLFITITFTLKGRYSVHSVDDLEKPTVNFNQLIITGKMVLWWYLSLSVSADAAFP